MVTILSYRVHIMIQGDQDWIDLAMVIAEQDAGPAAHYNADTMPERTLHVHLGPVPFLGAIATAPVVLLLTHADWDERATPYDHAFHVHGWPLSALHPDAPRAAADYWQSRAAELVAIFGAQQVANSIAALFLAPWRAHCFDVRLRLPSRRLMLGLAARAAMRDATLVVLRGGEAWTEADEIAALPPTRFIRSRIWRATELTPANLGLGAWDHVCRQIDAHVWI
jgi:hypothetical protein